MKLQDFTPALTVSNVETLFKNQFSQDLKFSSLTLEESKDALNKTRHLINEFKHLGKPAQHAETNPVYLKLKMIEEGVTLQIRNIKEHSLTHNSKYNTGLKNMTSKYAVALKTVASGTKLNESMIKSLNVSENLANVLKSRSKSIQLMRKIVENKQKTRIINEGEIDTAQTVLAAQDIADQIQTMIAKFADIRYKELPALQDSIRNTQGVEEATTFSNMVTDSLEKLTDNLETTKTEINNAIATLTGDEPTPVGDDLDLDNMDDDSNEELGADDLGDDFDMDFSEEPSDEEAETNNELSGFGREKR